MHHVRHWIRQARFFCWRLFYPRQAKTAVCLFSFSLLKLVGFNNGGLAGDGTQVSEKGAGEGAGATTTIAELEALRCGT